MDTTAEHFIDWFKLHGSQHASIGLTEFPGMGRGAIALDDIEVGNAIRVAYILTFALSLN